MNGTYTATADNLDGFSAVTVAVPSGAGATITVSYSSAFYDKTMTCTKGGTTYTETTTSAGATVFTVNDSGTWTITCNGVSRTVEVVLAYSTEMAITATVDVYSAASDTISFTDVTGAKTVTTDTSGHGSVSISFIPNGSITFTSSVAKNPTSLSQSYSKTITMTDGISSIYVMPDKVLYWYGNKVNITTTSYGGVFTYVAPTWNTTNATVTLVGKQKDCHFVANTAVTTTKAHCIATTPLASNTGADLYIDSTYTSFASSNNMAYVTHTGSGAPKLICFSGSVATGTTTITLYALWYE